jgi:acyl-CoA thioester hydrolase
VTQGRAEMTKKETISYEMQQTVPFHDIDPMQIVWHGNYLKYFDIARFGLFQSVGVDLWEFFKETNYLFPITKTTTKHIIPLRYGDEFICKATIVDARIKIIIDFEIRLIGKREICTKGKGDQVAVKYPELEMMLEIPIEIRKPLGF